MNQISQILKMLGTKKYPTLNSYFNNTPKLWFKILFVFYCVTTVLGLLIDFSLIGLISGVITVALMYGLCLFQDMYEYLRVGKHLKKYHNLEGDALVAAFNTMEQEANRPLYKDIPKQKSFSFMVTENWIIGSDGVMLLRMNACKRSDVTSVEMKTMSNSKQTFYILQVKDKNNYTYQFALISPENVQLAYDFLKSTQEVM